MSLQVWRLGGYGYSRRLSLSILLHLFSPPIPPTLSSPLPSLPLPHPILPPPQTSAPPWNRTGEPVRGSTALLTGYLVAYTQLIPEHQVQIFGRLKIRVKVSVFLALLCNSLSMVSCELLSGIGIGVHVDAEVDSGLDLVWEIRRTPLGSPF